MVLMSINPHTKQPLISLSFHFAFLQRNTVSEAGPSQFEDHFLTSNTHLLSSHFERKKVAVSKDTV